MFDKKDNLNKILEADSPAEYLENIGKEVEYLENGKVKVEGGRTKEGEQIYLTIKEKDITNIIEEMLNAGKSPQEVFDKYVIERTLEKM